MTIPAQHVHTSGEGPHRPLDVWLRLAINATDAVAKLHQSGVIHQHIRPGTLQIDPKQGSVELTGAGLTRAAARWELKVPPAGLPYVSPEQVRRVEAAI